MSDQQYKRVALVNSIVNQDSVQLIVAEDKDEPFTYLQWLQSAGIPNDSGDDISLKKLYDSYISEWRNTKNEILQSKKRSNIELFSNFLKQVDLQLTVDERRFIDNLDYNDPLEIESALEFFVSKIREVSEYYSDRRDQAKFEVTKNSIKGSNQGVALHVYNQLTSILADPDTSKIFGISPSQASDIIKDLKVSVEELYDLTDYSNTIRPSLTGISSSSTYDPYMFIDDDTAVQNLLNSYDVTLVSESGDIDIVSNNASEFELQFDVPLEDVSLLPASEFIEYDQNDLNISNIKKLIVNGSGSRMDYLSSGPDKSFKTGTLFDATSNIQNIHSNEGASVNSEQSHDVRTEYQLGGFFKPSMLGTLNYYSIAPKPIILEEYIHPETMYFFPELSTGNNASDIPVDYYENVSYTKNNYLENGTVGEINKDISHIPRFYNYQSSLQTNTFSREGISRRDDNFNFWTGDLDQLWSNADVYGLDVPNVYKIDERQESLISNKGHAYNWLTDSYGNEFALIKKIRPFSILSPEDFELPEAASRCTILDGSTFYLENNLLPDYPEVVNENDDCFKSFVYEIVRNGSYFIREACDFAVIENEAGSILPRLKGNRVYCSTIDGYIFGYYPVGSNLIVTYTDYKQYSVNVDSSSDQFAHRPVINNIWDGGGFDQLCVDVPVTETIYKIESSDTFHEDSYEYNSTKYSTETDVNTIPLGHQHAIPGDLYVRNSNSSSTGEFKDIAPRVFGRYSDDIKTGITEDLIEFDVIGNIIIFRTSTQYIFDKISYNYSTGNIESYSNPVVVAPSVDDIMSDYFFDEVTGVITICEITPPVDEQPARVQLHTIDTNTLEIQSTKPDIVHDEGASIFISDIKKPHITKNPKSLTYYITFLCAHKISNSFSIAQLSTQNLSSNTIVLDMYTTPTTMINTESEVAYPKVGSIRITLSDSTDDYLATFSRSAVNTLSINPMNILSDETVVRLEVDYGDGNSDNIDRTPVINYKNFESAIGSDLRDPRSYLFSHDYTSASPGHSAVKIPSPIPGGEDVLAVKHTCKIIAHTIEGSRKVYTINVYIQKYDITSHFSSLDIYSTAAYRDKYGNENMLLTFISKSPEYITNVVLKLNTPIREHISLQPSAKSIDIIKDIDMSNISLIID